MINATQVWLTMNPNLFTQNDIFLSWYDNEYCFIKAGFVFVTIKATGSVYIRD